ncbi:MAG: hypothetical protein KGJ02_06160 [Verrucomicrobiota bacterium]|nr:hypothetical protein [Verrucomicrobiota bacterium]
MMIETLVREFEEEKNSLWIILGPLFLLCTGMLAARPGFVNADLLLISAFGLFLSAKWRIRGCVYALLLLSLAAIAKHLMMEKNHLWQLGLESSAAFSLLISALVFEQQANSVSSAQQILDTRDQTIRNLEEELTQQKEATSAEQIASNEKLASLQAQYEELQAELSSFQMLNEVLRKSTAKAIEEKEQLANTSLGLERRIDQSLCEINDLQIELNRIKNESSLAQQNAQLFHELNETRTKNAQTNLINETLVRLHAKESHRAKELEFEKEQWTTARADAEQALQQARQEWATLQQAIEQMQQECASLKQSVEASQEENVTLRQQLAEVPTVAAPEELVEERGQLLLQVEGLRKQMNQVSQIEPLYRQLKAQFEEKNNVLHQTRVQLFRTDTELQTLKQEIQQQAVAEDPMPPVLRAEIEVIEKENSALSEENLLLQDLVSHLMGESSVKKKPGEPELLNN